MTKKRYEKLMFNSLVVFTCGIGFITVGIIATIIELIH
jgi:hypothetical protein